MRESRPGLPNIHDILIAYIKNQFESSFEVAKFKNAIRSYFFLSETRSLREFFDGKKGKASDNHKLEKIRQLHFGFNIPYKIFHKDLRHDHIFTDYSPQLATLRAFVPLNYAGKTSRDEEEFINRYISGVRKFILQGRRSITVYEYLGKGRQFNYGAALSYYEEAHKDVFDLIEKQIKDNPDLKYTRFLALPFSDIQQSEFQEHKESFTIQAVTECSLEVYKHLCRCFKNLENQVDLYIVWRPTRLYHYGIIDDIWVVSEYYRYRRHGDFVPDLLFVQEAIDEKDNPLCDLLRTYHDEINNKLIMDNDERSFPLSFEDFKSASFNAKVQLESKLKNADKDCLENKVLRSKLELISEKLEEFTNTFKD